jgi:hypothetical protein
MKSCFRTVDKPVVGDREVQALSPVAHVLLTVGLPVLNKRKGIYEAPREILRAIPGVSPNSTPAGRRTWTSTT